MKEENKNRKVGIIIGLVLLFITIIGVTYAAFQYTKKGTKENEITTGAVSFLYNETSNGVTLTDAYPTTDEEGKKLTNDDTQKYFDFDVTSTIGGDITIPYFVYAVDITGEVENKLSEDYVKIYLTDQDDQVYEGYEDVPTYDDLDNVKGPEEVDGKLLYQDTFYESGVKEFRLRMWVSDKYEVSEEVKTFKIRVDVSTDASIIPKDKKGPTCIVLNQNKTQANRDEDITMDIKCTDESGTVVSNMTKENIHVLVNNEEVEPTKKELTEGVSLTEATNNGIQHTLTLNGFEKDGPIKIKIDSGVVSDKYNNTNEEIEIDTGVKINKRVTVTLQKGDGVESISPDESELYCDITEGNTCNITLPDITPKVGYDEGYWTEEERETTGKTGSIEVSNNTTLYAKANDIESPVCKIYNAVGKTVPKEGNVDVQIDCTDNSGSINKDLTAESLTTLIDGNEVSLTKSISNTTPIENGKRYTLHLEGFKNLGPLTVKIPANAVTDNSGKGNIETTLTTEVKINDTIKVTLVKGDGVSSIEDKTELTCTIEKDGSGCNVTLPSITPEKDGYTGYWSENNNAHEGEEPGSIEVKSSTTYYALVKKDVNITYETAGGVTSIGKQNDKCTLYGNDANCSIELPSITVKEGYTGSFWSTEATAKSGSNPSTSVEVNADDTYYARGTKLVNVTYTKTSGVSSLTKDSDSCTRYGDEETCSITLPTITGNKGYDQTYWGEQETTDYASKIDSTTVTPSDTTTYYAFAKDIEAPVCKLESTEPPGSTEIEPSGTVKIVVNCTDNSGSISNDLTKENITVTYDGEAGTADITVDSGTGIENGKSYTITLTNFSGTGVLATTIKEGAIKDASNNQMTALPITTGITIKSKTIDVNGLPSNLNEAEYNEKTKHEMFEFSQPDGSTAYRYIGDDPYNYVKMNDDNSIWRIIGVFNDPDSTGSKTQQRIKLIKDQSVGKIAWDTSNSNTWTRPATLQTELNSGSTYNSLSASLKGKIEKMKWYLGGFDWGNDKSLKAFFNQERGSKGAPGAPTTWDGYVGLMYPSDYGYTYEKGIDTTCTGNLNWCSNGNPNSGWIYKGHSSEHQWTLTPGTANNSVVLGIYPGGYVSTVRPSDAIVVRPVVYLKPGTTFSDGEGTSTKPYIF